ncbi:fucose 4-O-acetylase-like acetyltransferase [Cerasibacillus quisquiliarum]|uniref:Acyltransferase n=1 Tax=Cerasibacillus quisquiliarum TaxID=227865 RepID=A0A511UW08_9BACI|nr:acyltransferase family protein [Cerasibacillus quisquiliarum]MBB5145027.1 fucose 4-O-acetylase-like acetyltransferase [Cerasibacillus quisquiliarum]GEN30081.1 acyltransferase [Cerasibacillus quisquiliarum]
MKRYAYFDNAKLLLIFLVVFGHMIQPFTNDVSGVNTIYTWIYTFHMPAFIFLAGFFAKGSGNKAYILKLAKKLLIPYIIFQVIYTGYYFLIGKDDWLVDSIFYPHWSLWFLFSLFCWHMLLIFFKKLPPIVGILLAVQIGLLVGYFGHIGHSFSLSRTFVFFPYFLLGYWITVKQLSWVKHKAVKIFSLVFVIGVAIAIHYAPDINAGWLLASKSYSDLGLPEYGGFARFFIYLTSTLMVVSVLAWIPRRQFKFTLLGGRTLYVYLLHGFIIQYARQADLFKVDHIVDLFGLAALSIAIVFILSSRPVQGISQPLIEGRMSILRKYVY